MKKRDAEEEYTIEIAYGVHDYFGHYYEYLGVSMASVMENTEEALNFHVLCDDTLTKAARETLTALCESYGQHICFYEIRPDGRISVPELLQAGYSEGILYRLYLPELLGHVRKILYLDVDILVHGDIRELWKVDVENCAAAGRWDPPLLGFKPVDEKLRRRCQPFWEAMDWNLYINSGVLVLNLEKIRNEHHLMEEAISFWNRYGMMLPDQDALNYILRGKTTLLSTDYNMPNKDYPVQKKGIFYHYTYMAEERDVFDPVDRLYLSYWEKTPFYRPDYGKKEKARFLRLLKNSAEIYERLDDLRLLDRDGALQFGWCLYQKGEFRRAYEYLSDGRIEKLPFPDGEEPSGEIWSLNRAFLMARSLRKMERQKEAAALLRHALAPDRLCAYLEHDIRKMEQWRFFGELCYETGEYEEAAEAFLKCLYFGTPEKNACAAASLLYLIKCMLRMERIAEAERYYTMLHTLAPLDHAVKLSGLQIERAKRKRLPGEEVVRSKNSIGNVSMGKA